MPDSKIWLVDQVAAANLARSMGLDLNADEMCLLTRHLAEHRISTFDLGVSRIHSKVSEVVQNLLNNHQHKSGEWSDGCLSAEGAILAVTSSVMSEIKPSEQRSTGKILRTMFRHARQKAIANPQYQVIQEPAAQNALIANGPR